MVSFSLLGVAMFLLFVDKSGFYQEKKWQPHSREEKTTTTTNQHCCWGRRSRPGSSQLLHSLPMALALVSRGVPAGKCWPGPGIWGHVVTRPLLVYSHNVEPGESTTTGTAGELLLHAAFVAPMPIQGILDRITPIATRATIFENRFWNTVGKALAAITRAHSWKAVPPSELIGQPVSRSVGWSIFRINRKKLQST